MACLRSFLRFRYTLGALVVVLAVAWLNVPGDRRTPVHEGSEWAFVDYSDHGWPWVFLTRRERFGEIPHPPISIWQLTTHVEDFSPFLLFVNILVVLAVALPIGWFLARKKPELFRLQFSLSTLFFATAVGGVVLAALIHLAGRYQEHRQFVVALRELKAWISVIPHGPDWLRDLLPNNYRVFDEYDSIGLPAEYLSPVLAGDEPNNAFVRLCACPQKMAGIKSLSIVECKEFTDRHLAVLQHARNLEDLDISDTSVTGEGFASLSVLRQLRFLRFRNTPVTDEALDHLSDLPRLQGVSWPGSKVSPEAALRLKARYSKWRRDPN